MLNRLICRNKNYTRYKNFNFDKNNYSKLNIHRIKNLSNELSKELPLINLNNDSIDLMDEPRDFYNRLLVSVLSFLFSFLLIILSYVFISQV